MTALSFVTCILIEQLTIHVCWTKIVNQHCHISKFLFRPVHVCGFRILWYLHIHPHLLVKSWWIHSLHNTFKTAFDAYSHNILKMIWLFGIVMKIVVPMTYYNLCLYIEKVFDWLCSCMKFRHITHITICNYSTTPLNRPPRDTGSDGRGCPMVRVSTEST